MDEPMAPLMRIKKRLHFLICCWCERYEEQLHYIHETARQFPEHADEVPGPPLSEQVKQRMKRKLAEQAR